jgi:hypothetical protein
MIQMTTTTHQTPTPTTGKGVAPLKSKATAVMPIKPPPADIAFPGGTVSPVCDGRMTVTLDPGNGARTLGGSNYQAFTETLLETVLATLPTRNPADMAKRVAAAAAALAAFKAVDEIEGLLAGQATALHFAAMECLRRATLPDQHHDVASKLRKDAANLVRTMVDVLDALDRRRGKVPQQTIRIEKVTLAGNAQAIVGANVAAGAGRGEG